MIIKSVRIEVNGLVEGLELSSSCFFPRAPIDSMFVVLIGDEYLHGVSVEGDVFWRLNDLERALKPGDWMRSFKDINDCMAMLSNIDPGEDMSLFDSVFLTDMGLFKMFAACISKTQDITRGGAVSVRTAKSLRIELPPGHLTYAVDANVDKFRLAPAIAKEVAKTGTLGDHVQRSLDIYRILSRITVGFSKSRATSAK